MSAVLTSEGRRRGWVSGGPKGRVSVVVMRGPGGAWRGRQSSLNPSFLPSLAPPAWRVVPATACGFARPPGEVMPPNSALYRAAAFGKSRCRSRRSRRSTVQGVEVRLVRHVVRVHPPVHPLDEGGVVTAPVAVARARVTPHSARLIRLPCWAEKPASQSSPYGWLSSSRQTAAWSEALVVEETS